MNDSILKLATRLRICAAAAIMFVILGAGGCPQSGPPAGNPAPQGIHFADATGEMSPGPWGRGEIITFPIAVSTLEGEQAGQTVTVTMSSTKPDLIEFASTSFPVVLAAPGQVAYATVTGTMRQTSGGAAVYCNASRTSAVYVAPPLLSANVGGKIVDDLFRTSTIPVRPDVPRGGSQTFTVQVWPRGDYGGPAVIDLSTNSSKLTVTPTQLTVNLVQGATDPVTATVILSAAADAGTGDHNILLQDGRAGENLGRMLETIRFKVTAVTNGPSFTLVATPSTVNASNNNPVVVYFTVTSVNNFSGDVTISYSSEQESWVDPPEEPFVVTVSPGNPVTFMRSLTRFFGTAPVQITFTGRNPTVVGDKTVTVTLNHTD